MNVIFVENFCKLESSFKDLNAVILIQHTDKIKERIEYLNLLLKSLENDEFEKDINVYVMKNFGHNANYAFLSNLKIAFEYNDFDYLIHFQDDVIVVKNFLSFCKYIINNKKDVDFVGFFNNSSTFTNYAMNKNNFLIKIDNSNFGWIIYLNANIISKRFAKSYLNEMFYNFEFLNIIETYKSKFKYYDIKHDDHWVRYYISKNYKRFNCYLTKVSLVEHIGQISVMKNPPKKAKVLFSPNDNILNYINKI